jgi:predicted ATPase
MELVEIVPHNLPRPRTSLVGRDQELGALSMLLSDLTSAVVTLIGTGGSGKTRLALEAANSQLTRFPDGVWFIDLAPLQNPALVPSAVAVALGVREGGGETLADSIAGHLANRTVLLVLDNCEHVIDGGAGLASTLIGRCPRLVVLATSRAPLRVPVSRS